MILKEGDKLLIAHRRLFEGDLVRYFIGHVEEYETGVVKATGHTYVRDAMDGLVIEKADARTKIFSLSSGTLIVYQLPDNAALESLKFVSSVGRLTLTDGKGFTMNLTEATRGGRV
jgi:hypothetical protein